MNLFKIKEKLFCASKI